MINRRWLPRIAKLMILLLLQLGIFLGGSFTQPALALTTEQKLLNEIYKQLISLLKLIGAEGTNVDKVDKSLCRRSAIPKRTS